MASQRFNSPGARKPSLTAFSAINTTATESCLWNNGVTTALQIPYTQIPAYDMQPGNVYKVSAGGTCSTTATGPTFIMTPRIGSNATAASNVTLGASTSITTPATSGTALPWYAEFTAIVRSVALTGNGATVVGNGFFQAGQIAVGNAVNTTTGQGWFVTFGGTAATTVDDSAAVGICLDVTWGTSNLGNTITCQWVKFEDN